MTSLMSDKTKRDGFLVAIDGGGTKTEICVLNLADGSIGTEVLGSANYKSSDEKTAAQNILDGFNRALAAHGVSAAQVRGAVFGIAGCDTESDLDFYRQTIASLGLPRERTYVCNDSEMTLLAAVDEGICVVAGTGSIASGVRADSRKKRAGGWGAPMSDEGSGWWIANEVFKRYLRWSDGVDTEEQPYFERITQQVGDGDRARAVARIAQMTTSEAASYARDIMQRALLAERPCAEVVTEAAYHIAEIIACVHRALGFEEKESVCVATVGSLFNDVSFRDAVSGALGERFGIYNTEFFKAADTPAGCGLELAKKLFLD